MNNTVGRERSYLHSCGFLFYRAVLGISKAKKAFLSNLIPLGKDGSHPGDILWPTRPGPLVLQVALVHLSQNFALLDARLQL